MIIFKYVLEDFFIQNNTIIIFLFVFKRVNQNLIYRVKNKYIYFYK